MSATNSKWWSDKGDAAALWSVIRRLQSDHASAIRRYRINRRVYSSRVGREVAQRADVASVIRAMGFIPADLNFTRPIVDALWSRIGNNQPAVKVAADGASWGQRRRAKQLDTILEGTIESTNTPAKASECLRDSLVVPGGILEITPGEGKIVIDRVPCEELLYDEDEAKYGEPRQLHRVMRISRDVLKTKYPKHASAIDAAKAPMHDEGTAGSTSRLRAMCEVAKSWHLPSGPDAGDGLWCVSIDGTILDSGPWERETYPLAIMRGSPAMEGFWPASLVDDLANLQYQVNSLFRKLQENAYHTSTLKVQVKRGANIAKKHTAGQRPHYVEVDNFGDVQWHVPDPFPPSHLQFLEFQIRQMHEVSGVSQLMVQSKNPLGAGASGAALAEFYDIESERFSQLELGYARFWRDIGLRIIEAAKDLADDDEFRKTPIRWTKNKSVVHSVKWEEVDFEKDRFELHLEPVGLLPTQRAGKMQMIEQLIAGGFLDPKWGTTLLDFPDIKRANLVRNAPVEWSLWAMEQLEDVELDEDEENVIEDKSAEIPPPDPHADLDFAMAVAKATYLMQRTEGDKKHPTPQPVLDRYLTFMTNIEAEKKKASQGAQTQAPMAGTATMTAPPMPGGPPDMAGAPMPPMPGGDMAQLPPMPVEGAVV